jgi:hypothetical protein
MKRRTQIKLKIIIVALAVAALPVSAFSQGIEIGPRGVEVDPGPGFHEHGRDGYARECEELRRACLYKHELGEEGEGNCERYREQCR